MSALRRIAGVGAIAVGAVLTVWELVNATYVVITTAIVLSVVWPLVGGNRRNMRLRKQITLVASITVGFWVFTTTALGFAESNGADEGGGASSLVTVSPAGRQMSARDLTIHGTVITIGFAAVAFGLALAQKKTLRGRRKSGKALKETSVA